MRSARLWPVALLFFLSGATALAAEVALNKLLSYVFGSSHLATSTVLAAYMAGLSAGAYLVGRASERFKRPLLVYAALELLVGAFYGLLPTLFNVFQGAAIAAARPLAAHGAALTALRFSLSFGLVLLPTLLMGGTLPTLVSAFQKGSSARRSLPALYATNTLGAAAGTLVSSYALIPALGLDGMLYGAAGINALIAVVAIVLHRRGASSTAVSAASVEEARVVPEPDASWHLAPGAALALAFAQGTLAFGLEVIWAHLIGTQIGVTTYAFSLMLFAILLGIGAGSALVPRLDKRAEPLTLFVLSALALALTLAVTLYAWDRFALVVQKTPSLAWHGPKRFWGREGVRLAFCLALLFPPSLALGVSLPSIAASVGARAGHRGAWVGKVFAANTLGTITGSLVTGFWLLGRVPSSRLLGASVLAALGMATAAVVLGKRAPKKVLVAAFAAAIGALTLLVRFPGFNPERLTLGTHYYWHTSDATSRVTAMYEDAQSGFITVAEHPDGERVLKTNGKYEGSDARREFQDLFALFGALYIKRFDNALLLGIGPSRTLRILYEMPFGHIDALEFSPAILKAARDAFGEFSKEPFEDKARVTITCDDGRNFLQLSKTRYDYIAVAITGAAFAGAGNIYSRDFFRAVKDKLADDGIFMLWIQVHHVRPEEVRSTLFTLRAVFPHVHFYNDPTHTQGYLIASKGDLFIDAPRVERATKAPWIQRTLAMHNLTSPLDLVQDSLFVTDEEVKGYFESALIAGKPELFTDMRPSFEHRAPFGLAEGIYTYDFEPFSKRRLPRFSPPLPPGEEAALLGRRLWMARAFPASLAALREAKRLSGSGKWDYLISLLEGITGEKTQN